MGAKIYTNPNMAIDTSSDFGPDEIVDYMAKFEQMKNNQAASKRADAQLAIDQANQKFLEETRHKTEVATNAMSTWSSYGINSQITGAENPTPSFNQTFDYQGDFDRAWAGYSRAMKASGQAPNQQAFEAEFGANYNSNLTKIANRFSALRDSERVRTGITDTSAGGLLDRYMQKHHNADNLYMTIATLHGADEAQRIMNYSPASAPSTWAKKAKKLFYKDSYTDPETGETMGGGLTKTGAATMIAFPALGAGEIARRSYKQFGPAKKTIMDEAKKLSANYKSERKIYEKVKDKKTGKMVNKLNKQGKPIVKKVIPASGIKPEEFKAKYNMLKSEAFDKSGKPSDKFIKKANALARRETLAGKGLSYGRRYGGIAAGAGIGSQIGESLGGAITGGPGGEMAGSMTGGLTGAYAGAKGQRSLMKAVKQLSKPETLEKLRWWAKGRGAKSGAKKLLLKALGKLGISAAGYLGPQVAEPISTVAGLAGTAFAAHDIYQIAKEFPELMDIIFTEE